MPRIGQNLQPFIGHIDVSICEKNSRVGRKQTNKQTNNRVFILFEQEVRIKEHMVVAFMEPIECVSSSVNEPDVCHVGKATERKSPEFLLLVFVKRFEHLT